MATANRWFGRKRDLAQNWVQRLKEVTGTGSLTITGSNNTGSVQVINGSGLGTAGKVYLDKSTGLTSGKVEQAVSAWSASQITFTLNIGTLKYGGLAIYITQADGTTLVGQLSKTVIPIAANGYVDLVSPLSDPSKRLTATGDLAAPDQIEYTQAAMAEVFSGGHFSVDVTLPSFQARANDGTGWGSYGTQQVIPITGTAPFIITQTLAAMIAGRQTQQALLASGDAPITFSVTGGSLPSGLALSSTGLLSGAPGVSAPYSFTVTATNAFGTYSSLFEGIVQESTPSVNASTTGDAILQATGGPTVNDGLMSWYELNGAFGDTLQDREEQFLALMGFYGGGINDRWMSYLGSLGYEGSLPDRWLQFWQGAGTTPMR